MFDWISLALVITVIVVLTVIFYNKLVALRNRVRNALAQIDVQLQRRHDLIPNLVASVKGYLEHEASVLEAVTQARQQAQAAKKANSASDASALSPKLMAAESALDGALMNLFAVQESYPELKADSTVMELMNELQHTENRIGFARQAYNDSVMVYRVGRESFPANIVANVFNFADAPMWELQNSDAVNAPKVQF